jgi:hypothetical protein
MEHDKGDHGFSDTEQVKSPLNQRISQESKGIPRPSKHPLGLLALGGGSQMAMGGTPGRSTQPCHATSRVAMRLK